MERPRLHITAEDFSVLPKMSLDDSGTMTIKFKVKGANIYDDEAGFDDKISYDLEYEIEEVKVNKKGLKESIEDSLEDGEEDDPIRVKTQYSPFPAG